MKRNHAVCVCLLKKTPETIIISERQNLNGALCRFFCVKGSGVPHKFAVMERSKVVGEATSRIPFSHFGLLNQHDHIC